MFSVTKRFFRSEMREKDFAKLQDAENFIYEKLREDILFKVNATYCIYEGADFLKEYTQKEVASSTSSSESASSSQQQSGRKVFSPTPLSTTPRPKGMPQNWRDEKEDDNKKE